MLNIKIEWDKFGRFRNMMPLENLHQASQTSLTLKI